MGFTEKDKLKYLPDALRIGDKDDYLVVRNRDIWLHYFDNFESAILAAPRITGLPEGCYAPYLIECLMRFNKAAIYQVENSDIWLGTDYIISTEKLVSKETGKPISRYDVYGRPRRIYGKPAGSYTKKTRIPVNGQNFVLIKGRTGNVPMLAKIGYAATSMWEVHDTLRANLENQLTPWIPVAPKSMKLTYENIFNRIRGHQRVVQLTNGVKKEDLTMLDNRCEYHANELEALKKAMYNDFLAEILGISSDSEKRERMNIDEVGMAKQGDNLMAMTWLKPIQDGLDELNERFGFDAHVTLSTDIFNNKLGGIDDGVLYNSSYDDNEQSSGETSESAEN